MSPDKQETAVVSAKVASAKVASSPINTPETKPVTAPAQVIFDKDDALCMLHLKSIEAFCQEDSTLVCIDCILSNEHKGHTLHAIDTAIDLQVTHIGEQNQKTKTISTSLDKQKQEINEKLKAIIDSCVTKK
jgi:septal ring factor EnvC (AmiA/AmiB activator)